MTVPALMNRGKFPNSVEQMLFSREGYVADLMKNYGNGGRPINLPQQSDAVYQGALKFREREKVHYKNIENELRAARGQVEHLQQSNAYMAGYLNEFLNHYRDAPDACGSDDDDDCGNAVLPAEGDPTKVHTNIGQPEAIISSTKAVTDEPPNRRANRSRRDDALKQPDEAHSEGSTHGADAGGSLAGPSDGPEPDVDRQAGEHGAAE